MSTVFTDGSLYLSLELQEFDPFTGQNKPDWSADFCDTGILEQDETGAFIVDDLDCLLEAALDWKYGVGDFHEVTPPDPGFRSVYVNGCYLTRKGSFRSPHNTEARLDPITHQPISKYDNECSAILSSTRWIRQLCDTIDHTFRHISDKADPKLVSEIVAEVRRAETALSFANNAKWRCAK